MNGTNAERLATTKNSVKHARKFIGDDGGISFQYAEALLNDFDWVIEQAERVPELEKDIEALGMAFGDGANDLVKSHDEIKRLRDELKESQRINSVMDDRMVGAGREIISQENERAEMQCQIDQLNDKYKRLVESYNELFIQEKAMQKHYQLAFSSMQMYKKCCDDITAAMNTERPAEEKTKDVRHILEGVK